MCMCALMLLFVIPWSTSMPMEEAELMSWYGEPFHGRLTAAGEVYNMNEISVAHRTLPIGTEVMFHYDGRFVPALVTDRGPYSRPIYDESGNIIDYTRDWDASRRLAKVLFREDIQEGVLPVQYYLTGNRVIREGMRYNLGL